VLVLVGVRPVCSTQSPLARVATRDKHKAPTLPHIRPLSLQDPIRLSTFIRIGADTLPDLVVKIHQGDRSNGQGLFFTIEPCLNDLIW